MESMDDTASTVTLYLDDSQTNISVSEWDPHSVTINLNESLQPGLLYDCSLCKQISDYRRTSYICLDCLQDYQVVTRICRHCISIETILGRTSAYSEWNTDGTFDIVVNHLHKPPGSQTAYIHRLYCVPL